jgi:hypothetical protein
MNRYTQHLLYLQTTVHAETDVTRNIIVKYSMFSTDPNDDEEPRAAEHTYGKRKWVEEEDSDSPIIIIIICW